LQKFLNSCCNLVHISHDWLSDVNLRLAAPGISAAQQQQQQSQAVSSQVIWEPIPGQQLGLPATGPQLGLPGPLLPQLPQ
jgi:hypothetical protein